MNNKLVNTINKSIKNLQLRKDNIEKSIEYLQEIMQSVTKIIPDAINWTGKKIFDAKIQKWNGNEYRVLDSRECENCFFQFIINNGEIVISYFCAGNEIQYSFDELEGNILYIDLPAAIRSLMELIELLPNIYTFNEDTKKLEEISKAIS